jgi:hypothetical protein
MFVRFVKFASAKDAVLSLTDGVDTVDRNDILSYIYVVYNATQIGLM